MYWPILRHKHLVSLAAGLCMHEPSHYGTHEPILVEVKSGICWAALCTDVAVQGGVYINSARLRDAVRLSSSLGAVYAEFCHRRRGMNDCLAWNHIISGCPDLLDHTSLLARCSSFMVSHHGPDTIQAAALRKHAMHLQPEELPSVSSRILQAHLSHALSQHWNPIPTNQTSFRPH